MSDDNIVTMKDRIERWKLYAANSNNDYPVSLAQLRAMLADCVTELEAGVESDIEEESDLRLRAIKAEARVAELEARSGPTHYHMIHETLWEQTKARVTNLEAKIAELKTRIAELEAKPGDVSSAIRPMVDVPTPGIEIRKDGDGDARVAESEIIRVVRYGEGGE
jgi:chromosome segregation ATPase